MAYIIKDWDRIYENAQSRKVDKLLWVAMPNKHDSFGFRMLLSKPNGVALYGAWVLLVQLASKCEPRGTLVKSGVVLDIPTMAMLTNAPESILLEMIEAVQSKGIEWIEVRDLGGSQATPSQLVDERVLETTEPGTRARALLPSFPSFSEETLIGECAERMYALHPKKKNFVLVPSALKASANGTKELQPFLIEVETCHAVWCKTEDWTKKDGRFAPPLDQWLADRGFTKWPEGYKPPSPPLDESKCIEFEPFGLLAKRNQK